MNTKKEKYEERSIYEVSKEIADDWLESVSKSHTKLVPVEEKKIKR